LGVYSWVGVIGSLFFVDEGLFCGYRGVGWGDEGTPTLSGFGRVFVKPFLRGGFISSAVYLFLFAGIGFRLGNCSCVALPAYIHVGVLASYFFYGLHPCNP
jgi:hypothetical protein